METVTENYLNMVLVVNGEPEAWQRGNTLCMRGFEHTYYCCEDVQKSLIAMARAFTFNDVTYELHIPTNIVSFPTYGSIREDTEPCEALVESIKAEGQLTPLAVTRELMVVSGSLRLKALQKLSISITKAVIVT